MYKDFEGIIIYILIFCLAASLGFYLLSRAKHLFLFIKPELLRRNVVTFIISLCFFISLGHILPDFSNILRNYGWSRGIFLFCIIVLVDVILPYNLVIWLTESPRFYKWEESKKHLLIFIGIVLISILCNGSLNYIVNGHGRNLKYSAVWSFYISGFGSLIYLFIKQADNERKRKYMEKEASMLKLEETKTRAELEALQAKINPHFLYNALNSIADLSLRDGKAASQMSISLAELFRYSINYNSSDLTTIHEELHHVELYMQIEKIRFGDRLQYRLSAGDETKEKLIPRFILQPLAENAVKHGLSAAGGCNIIIEVLYDEALLIRVGDNGPYFPENIIPGYGLKNVYGKLELLCKDRFSVTLCNEPIKYIEIRIETK